MTFKDVLAETHKDSLKGLEKPSGREGSWKTSATAVSDSSLPVSSLQTPLTKPRRGEKIPSKKIIRDLGLKVTNQRLLILDIVRNGASHFTAQDIYEKVASKNPDLGFATVYRFLRTLSEQNFVTEMRMGGMPARYEWAAKRHHDHLTCSGCGKIVEFENPEIERLQAKVAKEFGFVLTDHVLELFGICADCRQEGTNSPQDPQPASDSKP